jgi:hypothetical protein
MERPTKRRKYAIGAIAGAVAAGAIAVPVIAQASSGGASATSSGIVTQSTSSNTAMHRGVFGGPMGPRGFGKGDRSGYDAAVAAKLGITTATFEAAEQAVHASEKPPTPGATGATAGAREAHRAAEQAALAAKLGVTTTALKSAEDAARQEILIKNLPTLVSHKVITQAQADALKSAATAGTFDTVLKSIEITNLTAHLAKDVAAGRLTQAQADKILARAKAATPGDGPGLGLGLGFGFGPGGPGGPRGHWGPRGAFGASGGTGAMGNGYSYGTPPQAPPSI